MRMQAHGERAGSGGVGGEGGERMKYRDVCLEVSEYGFMSFEGPMSTLILPVKVMAIDSKGQKWAIGEGEDGCLWAAAAEACRNARRFLGKATPRPEATGTLWEFAR
jgi:hypothetical protein